MEADFEVLCINIWILTKTNLLSVLPWSSIGAAEIGYKLWSNTYLVNSGQKQILVTHAAELQKWNSALEMSPVKILEKYIPMVTTIVKIMVPIVLKGRSSSCFIHFSLTPNSLKPPASVKYEQYYLILTWLTCSLNVRMIVLIAMRMTPLPILVQEICLL